MKKNIVKAENTDDDFLVVKQKIKGGKDEERSDTKMKELTANRGSAPGLVVVVTSSNGRCVQYPWKNKS